MKGLNRRTFISKFLLGIVGFFAVLTWPGRLLFAEIFSFWRGSEYVGKTRDGIYKTFYVQYYKSFKRIKAENWQLKVGGLCENPQNFSLSEIKALPLKEQISRVKCVECWSAKAKWTGFALANLEQVVQPLPQAVGVLFRCADRYVEYLSLKDLHHKRTLLVHTMNDAVLSDEHGFPLRLIIPFKYGYKSPKAILEMVFVGESKKGTWSKIGPYSVDATILPGYDHPLDRGKKRRRIFGGEIFD